MVAMVAKFMLLRPHSSTSYLLLSPPSFRPNIRFSSTVAPSPPPPCRLRSNSPPSQLLNCSRIYNIARVPCDEIEEGFQDLLSVRNGMGDDDEAMMSLNRRINGKAEGDGEELSPMLYRDKLSKESNSKGFVRFRNLDKISRSKWKKKKKKDGQESKDEIDNRARRKGVTVEVVEEGDEEGDLSGLIGDEFKGRRWRCSARLLLLDEKYTMKQADELPEAVKVQWWIL